jgi:hypothetical protein
MVTIFYSIRFRQLLTRISFHRFFMNPFFFHPSSGRLGLTPALLRSPHRPAVLFRFDASGYPTAVAL